MNQLNHGSTVEPDAYLVPGEKALVTGFPSPAICRLVILVGFIATGTTNTRASPGCRSAFLKLTDPAPAAFDYFGASVAVSQNWLVAGAPFDDAGGTDAGAVFVFDSATGELRRSIENPGMVDGSQFGWSVGISGDFILVGAPFDRSIPSSEGAAYLFSASTGSLLQTFSNPSQIEGERFGWAVAIWGNFVVVGAPMARIDGSPAGAGYLFDATTGSLLHIFKNPAPDPEDSFGHSVAIWGNTIGIGAPKDDHDELDGGRAYLYDALTGAPLRKLLNPLPRERGEFGRSIAVWENHVVVGSAGEAAYLFEAARGDLLRAFTMPEPVPYSRFGHAVAIYRNIVIIGAPGRPDLNKGGAAYIFDTAIGSVRLFSDGAAVAPNNFGESVAVYGENYIAGATWVNSGGPISGVAYALVRWDCPSPTPTPAPSPLPTPGCELTLPNPDQGSTRFAQSVAISNGQVLVGRDLFDASSGARLERFYDPSPKSESFGDSAAIAGGRALIGAPGFGSIITQGIAYLFDSATGVLLRAFQNPSPEPGDEFGFSVAISGDNALVGAPRDNTAVHQSGSAYLFDAQSGSLLQTINDPNPASGDRFGEVVAISGDNILVTSATGGAHLFNAENGALLRTLSHPGPAGSRLGPAGSIEGAHVLLEGSEPVGQAQVERAYLFDAATGSLLQTFNVTSPDAKDYDLRSVSISGNSALIGAFIRGTTVGGAYLFDAATGTLLQRLDNPNPTSGDAFGGSVAASGQFLIVGDVRARISEVSSGAAYIFSCPKASPSQLKDVLLGRVPPASEDDANGDGVIDVADLLLVSVP